VTAGRLVAAGAGALLGWVVVFGGEYSTRDWLTLAGEVRSERRAVSDLHEQLDSLAALAHAIETDPATQERVARERFGMIRSGEFLYRLVPPDTGDSR
jgi:cell division protein FtsB